MTEYDQHYNILVRMADEHGFVICDVIGNGDFLFNAIANQTDCSEKIYGLCLRAMTVEYLSDHPYISGIQQGNFVCEEIADPSLPVDLKWEFYLHQLANGAWGDHMVVQGISNLLKVTINILTNVFMTVVSPTDSICNVNVGLIEEKHYVGLDVVSNVTSV